MQQERHHTTPFTPDLCAAIRAAFSEGADLADSIDRARAVAVRYLRDMEVGRGCVIAPDAHVGVSDQTIIDVVMQTNRPTAPTDHPFLCGVVGAVAVRRW